MIDISATLEAVLNSDDAWIETEPAFADVVFSFDEFDPKNPKLQILFQNGPDTKTWVTKGVYRIEHQCLLTVFVRPVNYKPATITAAKTSFLNMKSEVDRILTGVDSTFLSGWKDEPLQVGRDTGKMHNEPIMFRAIQTVMVTGYLLPGGEVMNCTDVRACLEGDYSTWANQWEKAQNADWGVTNNAALMHITTYDDADKLLLTFGDYALVAFVVLSTGTLDSYVSPTISFNNYPGIYNYTPTSIRGKYWAGVINDGASAILKIYKEGTLVQSIDLTALLSWAKTAAIGVAINENGKYIAAQNYSTGMVALFKGT